MVVLLAGAYGEFTDALISKLDKDGHRVYLLTGTRNKTASVRRVHEKYDYQYEDECIGDVVGSIMPDVVIFMGAYDTGYAWEDPRRDSTRYISGLMNLLTAAAASKVKRFLYLSSEEVYGHSYPNAIREEEEPSAKTLRAAAIAQGESTCREFVRSARLQVTVLRLDNVYGIPDKKKLQDNSCFQKCLQGLKTGKITANSRISFSLLYLNDAVEFVYRIACEEEVKRNIYHLSSMELITEMQLARWLKESFGGSVEIIDNTVGDEYRVMLDAGHFQEEFGLNIYTDAQKGIKNVAEYMIKNAQEFLTADDSGIGTGKRFWLGFKRLFWATVPFIESLVCFAFVYFFREPAASSSYFARLDLYLLYVILFSIVYGQQQAVTAALLSMAGYIVQSGMGGSYLDVLLDYDTYVWIAQLFIVGMSIGYIKDQLLIIRREDDAEIRYLKGQYDDIVEINNSNVRARQVFETEIINQKDSLGKIYAITSSLEHYEPAEILFRAAEVISNLMNSPDVVIYRASDDGYAHLSSATSPAARKLGSTIRYTELGGMYEDLEARRIFVNRRMDETLPVMAEGVYDDGGLRLILMVWSLSFERMNLNQANKLVVIAELIDDALIRADNYLDSLGNVRHMEGTCIVNPKDFTALVGMYIDAERKGLSENSLLRIETEGRPVAEVSDILKKRLRETDYIGLSEQGGLYVLLDNTDDAGAEFVISKFASDGIKAVLEEIV